MIRDIQIAGYVFVNYVDESRKEKKKYTKVDRMHFSQTLKKVRSKLRTAGVQYIYIAATETVSK